ncbi:hypothetical protein GCM10022265_35010 [Marinobacter xestospongiae]
MAAALGDSSTVRAWPLVADRLRMVAVATASRDRESRVVMVGLLGVRRGALRIDPDGKGRGPDFLTMVQIGENSTVLAVADRSSLTAQR